MSQLSIVVIEDNAALSQMIKRRLEHLNYAVHLADSGETGKDTCRKIKPDIILLDIHLPGKDGWTIATELKSDPATKSTPIIAVTAHAMAGDREKAIRSGCDDYVTKPIDFPTLNEKIQYLVD